MTISLGSRIEIALRDAFRNVCFYAGPLQRMPAAAALLMTPAAAFAQRIPTEIAIAAVSPVFVIILAGVLGLLRRSWRTAGRHAGLVVVWVVLAGVAMYFIENDYIIWTPLAIYALHAALIGLLVVYEIVGRISGWPGRGSG